MELFDPPNGVATRLSCGWYEKLPAEAVAGRLSIWGGVITLHYFDDHTTVGFFLGGGGLVFTIGGTKISGEG